MAVKVISTKPHYSVVKEIICRNCGATLTYVPRDVKRRIGTDMSGCPDGREWIDCPQCNVTVTINSW